MLMLWVIGGGEDYDSGPYPIMFLAGMTSIPFSISINNDTTFEANETFMININSQLPYNIMVGDPVEAIVTIVDDDSKYNFHFKKFFMLNLL